MPYTPPMDVFKLHRGRVPLLISLPHDGTALPKALSERMMPEAREVPDTDWHVSRLYAFARELHASVIVPAYSRYVIDLNRPPDNASLYPGRNTTGLCPIVRFDGKPVYQAGQEPTGREIEQRIDDYWRPYHHALAVELSRLREEHGRVVLWDGHSIRSHVPFLFEGQLPDFNLGTADGASCSPTLEMRLAAILDVQRDYSHVVNGRFKGGYITRHYGKPNDGVDAIQLELAQCTYMDEDSFDYQPAQAERVQVLIRHLLEACLEPAA